MDIRPRIATRTLTTLLVLATLALGSSACGDQDPLERVAGRMTAVESASPFTIPSQTLTAHDGRPYDIRAGTAGRFALIYFGYTYCPDICPLQMATANAALGLLTEEQRSRVVLLFVTVDPQRDTEERLASWLGGMHSPGIGLRTSTTDLEKLLSAMGFVMPPMTSREQIEGGGPDDYLVPHPASLFLATPDGLGRFQYPYGDITPKEIADDLRMLMELPWDGTGADGALAGDEGSGGVGRETTMASDDHGAGDMGGSGSAGAITIRSAMVPANPGGTTLAVYAELTNAGEDDALVALRTEIAGRTSLHTMDEEGGMSTMRPIDRVDVPAGATVGLRRGALHGMLEELSANPSGGDTISVTFVFASGTEVEIRTPVVSLSDIVSGAAHSH